MAKQKYYVVWKGVKPGIYDSWTECEKQIKGFDSALYKSFESIEIATKAFKSPPHHYLNKPKTAQEKLINKNTKPIVPSISVDAACAGNPGVMEYQGVDTVTKQLIFHQGPFPLGTNNIGEFLALVHALAMCKQKGWTYPIYTDSATALAWLKHKKAKTKLERIPKNEELFNLVDRAEIWLANNSWENVVMKWDTDNWGEVPADFGRK